MISSDQLIAYASGTLAPEERARVEDQLAGDETALRVVLEQERMDASLRVLLGSAAAREQVKRAILEVVSGASYEDVKSSVLKDVRVAPRLTPRASRFTFPQWLAGWRGVLAGGLAAAACAALAFLVWPRAETMPPIRFAQLSDVRGAIVIVRDGGELAAKEGAALQVGDTIRLGDGASATARLADRTRLALDANAELQLGRDGDAHQFRLVAGRLAARVAKQPPDRPLTIHTTLATARVIGTEFRLEATPRETRIEVGEGLVRMAHAAVDSAVEVAGGEFALAVPQSELIAGLLPVKQEIIAAASGDRDPVARPFASDSPWNRMIGSGAVYADLQSPALDLAGHGGSVRPASHFRPFFVAKPGDPQRKIVSRFQNEVFATVPAPEEALRSGDWMNCVLIDPASATAFEMVGARRNGDVIETMLFTPVSLRGPGVPPAQGGNTFSGLPMIAGIIRAGELERGVHHALSVTVLHAGLNRRGPGGGRFVWPARHMPMEEKKLALMGESGNVFYGTRLALPRDLDLAQLGVGTSGPAFEIAKALRDYGAYVTHSFPPAPNDGQAGWRQPHVQFLAELPQNADWQKFDEEVSRIVRHLKVVGDHAVASEK